MCVRASAFLLGLANSIRVLRTSTLFESYTPQIPKENGYFLAEFTLEKKRLKWRGAGYVRHFFLVVHLAPLSPIPANFPLFFSFSVDVFALFKLLVVSPPSWQPKPTTDHFLSPPPQVCLPNSSDDINLQTSNKREKRKRDGTGERKQNLWTALLRNARCIVCWAGTNARTSAKHNNTRRSRIRGCGKLFGVGEKRGATLGWGREGERPNLFAEARDFDLANFHFDPR